MRHLRSRLFAVLVVLVALTGYSYEALGDCWDGHGPVGTEQTESGQGSHSTNAGDCGCLCHEVISLPDEALRIEGRIALESKFFPGSDEFPPDTVPVGIDYPPQLA